MRLREKIYTDPFRVLSLSQGFRIPAASSMISNLTPQGSALTAPVTTPLQVINPAIDLPRNVIPMLNVTYPQIETPVNILPPVVEEKKWYNKTINWVYIGGGALLLIGGIYYATKKRR